MKHLAVFYLLSLLSFRLWSNPMHIETAHDIIIDTDCAIDDMRAISLMLSQPGLDIKAILLSDGSLSPGDGVGKITALLCEFGRDTISVGVGTVLPGVNSPWRRFNQQLNWGRHKDCPTSLRDAIGLLAEKLKQDEKITLVCLGSLTNIAQLIRKDASIISRIDRVVWYNDSVNPLAGFNYECDKPAAELVLQSGIRIDVISDLKKQGAVWDSSMTAAYSQSGGRLSQILDHVYAQPAVQARLYQNHFRLYDDLVAVYILKPELFDMYIPDSGSKVRTVRDYDPEAVKELIDDLITEKFVMGESVAFSKFPVNRELYTYDVRQIMDSAMTKYGIEEWKANVMTDEFHGHLGVFSIVGAKMGTRARELLGADRDEVEVISFAGTKPPYSCMNDGIQVSTGATLGMGMIRLAEDSAYTPAAIFSFKERSVKLSLKAEYLQQLDKDIQEAICMFGLADEGYWHLVRQNAIRYWLNWDRRKIFDVEEVKIKQ